MLRASCKKTLEAVKKLGGWKSFALVLRYEKHARLALFVRQIPTHLLSPPPSAKLGLRQPWPKAFA